MDLLDLDFIKELEGIAKKEISEEKKQNRFKTASNCTFTIPSISKVDITTSKKISTEIKSNEKIFRLITPGENKIALPNFIFQKGMVTTGTSKYPGRGQTAEWINGLILKEKGGFTLEYEGEKPNIYNIPYMGAILSEYSKISGGDFGVQIIEIKNILKNANCRKGGPQYKQLFETLDMMATGRFIISSKDENGKIKPISNFAMINSYEQGKGLLKIDINPKVGDFLSKEFVQIDLKIFHQLKGALSKYLYCLIESNKKLTSLNREEISKLVTDFSLGKFRKLEFNRKFNNSLNQLYHHGIIPKYILQERNPIVQIGNRNNPENFN